jgi:hypothetical protein
MRYRAALVMIVLLCILIVCARSIAAATRTSWSAVTRLARSLRNTAQPGNASTLLTVEQSTTPTGSSRASDSTSQADPVDPTPLYSSLVTEFGDPDVMSRELDEAIIRWHLEHNPAVREE